MGEEVGDEYTVEGNSTPKLELKRSHECIVDGTQVENQNKKLAKNLERVVIDTIQVENVNKAPLPQDSSKLGFDTHNRDTNSIKNSEDDSFSRKHLEMTVVVNLNRKSAKVEDNCSKECNFDLIQVETTDMHPAEDSSSVESQHSERRVVEVSKATNHDTKPDVDSSIGTKCSHECVTVANEADKSNKKSEKESSNDHESPIIELKCSADCVIDATKAEDLNKMSTMKTSNDEDSPTVEFKCSNECVTGATEPENSNKKLEKEYSSDYEPLVFELESSPNCLIATVEAENVNKMSAMKTSNDEDSSTIELKCSPDCVIDAAQAENLNKMSPMKTSNDEDSSIVELKCSQECVIGATEADNSNKNPEKESSNDHEPLIIELKCSPDCVTDATDLENLNKMSAMKTSNDEDAPTVGLKCSNEYVIGATEAENSNKKPEQESSNDHKPLTIELKCSPDGFIAAAEADDPNKMSAMKTYQDSSRVELKCSSKCVSESIEVEKPNKNPTKESSNDDDSFRSELKCSHECVIDGNQEEDLNVKPTIKSSIDEESSRVELKCPDECVEDVIEVETSNNMPMDLKYLNECDVDATEVETPKTMPKDSSIESRSEVLNPNVSPQGNASSSQTVSSQHVAGCSRSGCGHITFSREGDSSTRIADKEVCCVNDIPSLSKSQAILEGPKDASTSGVKRIIFTFSKNGSSDDSISPSHVEVDNGFSYNRLCEKPKMRSLEKRMFKKGILENHPKNVKKLLATGILEGLEVKYINQEKQFLRGVIKGCEYLCGCDDCAFSKVLSAFEFERHAGCTTKHPNDHIFLNNGKSLHSIVQELKTMPISSLDGVLRALAGSLPNEEPYLEQKDSLGDEIFLKCKKQGEIDEKPRFSSVDCPQSTMSCSSEDTEDSLDSASRSRMQKFPAKHTISTAQGISKRKRYAPKKLLTSSKNSVGHVKKRDNDLHRLLFMPNGLPDGAALAYCLKGQRVLDGFKHGSGIVCSHCNSEISPSQFEAHAGCAAKRQPYRHIFTDDGHSLHDIALSLAKGQRLTISNSGDVCTICRDGDDLIYCSHCPRAFHEACLDKQYLPEGEWCCSYCKGSGSGGKVPSAEVLDGVRPITIRLTRVFKSPAPDVGGCVVCRDPVFSVMDFDERTVMLCDQCEKEYHVGCLRKCGMSDLKALPQGKWFCCVHCTGIHTVLQKLICTGAKVIPPLMLDTIKMKLIEQGLSHEICTDVKWQLLSGKFGSSEYQPLLSSAVTLFQDSFDPIVEQSGCDLIPLMVHGQSVSGQDFGGVYCAILSVKSVLVSAGLLRIFGQEVAELPLVATAKDYQGKGFFQLLLTIIMKLLGSLHVDKLVLPAAENAVSIWTKKFGFEKMSDHQFLKYSRDVDLISFKGTLMLERLVPPRQQPQKRQKEC